MLPRITFLIIDGEESLGRNIEANIWNVFYNVCEGSTSVTQSCHLKGVAGVHISQGNKSSTINSPRLTLVKPVEESNLKMGSLSLISPNFQSPWNGWLDGVAINFEAISLLLKKHSNPEKLWNDTAFSSENVRSYEANRLQRRNGVRYPPLRIWLVSQKKRNVETHHLVLHM